MVSCYRQATSRLSELVSAELRSRAGDLNPRSIVIKPNWVLHEADAAFPIHALVTDARLIEATTEACWQLFPNAQSILVADCPLQWADWPLLCRQSGLDSIVDRWSKSSAGRIQFRDLRKEVFVKEEGSFLTSSATEHGDPKGYLEVELGGHSHLEPISAQAPLFAVNDYSADVTQSNHRSGSHRYLVSRSILDADLLINLPKWKSHQKSAVTGALKNLVGINGDKAYLPHFRKGAPRWGGDEYRDKGRWLYYAQTTLREKFQKRSRWAYRALKPGWELIKKIRRIETRLTDPRVAAANFYIAGGSWHGNDTIWRMIYDLNWVIQRADATGRIQPSPQRRTLSFVDGLTAGEGNGPLQPLPRPLDWLVCGEDPFEIDAALCWFMGFEPEKVPLISHRREFGGPPWGQFDLDHLEVELDGQKRLLRDWEINFKFVPPPGWRGYVER